MARIPGFRPGRAPQAVVERRFAKDILEETREQLVPQAYHGALEQEKLKPVGIVDVSDIHLDKDLPLSFKVTVDVEPEFVLPNYHGISLPSKKPDVAEDEVERVIGSIRERSARFEDVAGRAARQGDIVQIDYLGACEGQSIGDLAKENAELGQGEDFWMLLGTPELIPGLADQLVDAAVGEKREATIVFPAEFAVKTLAGRRAIYTVTVKAIRERHLPELDASFFAQVGAESIEDLRGKVRKNLIKAAEQTERDRLKSEVLKWLVEQADLKDLPQSVVEAEARHIIRDVVEENTRRGVSQEEIEAHRDDIFNQAAQSAADRVRMNYILDRIAETDRIAVEDADVDREIQAMAGRYGVAVARIRASLEKREALEGLRRNLRMEKTLEAVLSAATIETA
jgi:trigger factor